MALTEAIRVMVVTGQTCRTFVSLAQKRHVGTTSMTEVATATALQVASLPGSGTASGVAHVPVAVTMPEHVQSWARSYLLCPRSSVVEDVCGLALKHVY